MRTTRRISAWFVQISLAAILALGTLFSPTPISSATDAADGGIAPAQTRQDLSDPLALSVARPKASLSSLPPAAPLDGARWTVEMVDGTGITYEVPELSSGAIPAVSVLALLYLIRRGKKKKR